MGEMVERVGVALAEMLERDYGVIVTRADLLAKAAIAAMREPTEAMVEAGQKPSREGHTMLSGVSIIGRWQAMIDAALADGPMTEPTSQQSQGSSEP